MKATFIIWVGLFSFCWWASYSCLTYLLTFWGSYLHLAHNDAPGVVKFFVSLIFSEIIFPATIITWLFSFLA